MRATATTAIRIWGTLLTTARPAACRRRTPRARSTAARAVASGTLCTAMESATNTPNGRLTMTAAPIATPSDAE